MSLALDELKAILKTDTNRVFTDEANSLLYPFAHNGQIFNVLIDLQEEGEYVHFSIHFLLNIREVENRENVLIALLELNRRLKALKYCYDPSDGEVSVAIEIPLEDGTLTMQQVHRCMYTLTEIAMRERDNLVTLIKTGVYPGSSDPGFTDTISRLLGSEGSEQDDLTDERESLR